jgi:tight adherence protein C
VVLILVLGLALGGTAVAFAMRAVAMPRVAAAARIGDIKAYGFTGSGHVGSETPRPRLVDAAADVTGRILAKHLSRFSEAEVRNHLMTAGLYSTAPMTFLGYRALAGFAGGATMLWVLSAAGSSGSSIFLGMAATGAAGWLVPMMVVRRRGAARMEQVDTDLPEMVDLMVVTVESGLTLSRSLQIAGERFHGPLRDEIRLTLQEQKMGLATSAALSNMLARCETPSMRSFVRSIVQGESLGVSMGTILRNLAVEMRKRRRQHAEERAHKAPTKMLFPLIFLMFPSLFIVLLFPALYSFLETFGR